MSDKKINILFDRDQLMRRTAELGAEISAFYQDKPLTIAALANGGIFFAVDLAREIKIPSCWIDVIALGSYVNDKKSGVPQFRCQEKLPVNGRHILLVDDVFDSGESMKVCSDYFTAKGALSVRSAVLMNKQVSNRASQPDWYCFKAPNLYLLGCGMDSNEEFRNMSEVAYLE